MSTLSNQIEQYLKELLARSQSGVLEIKRSDLAEAFTCVPSQINYVLATRFSPAQGYMVESRRGGGVTEEEFLTGREGMLIKALTDDSVLKSGLIQDGPDSEALRGRMLNAVLQLLLRDDFV